MDETFLHPTTCYDEDPHHADCEELSDNLYEQLTSRKMVCYLIIMVAVLLFIVFIMQYDTMVNYGFYAKDSGFPGPFLLMFVTFLILITVTYLSFHLTASSHHPTLVFWMYVLILISYTFTIINLAVRSEYYAEGLELTNNGSVWLVIALMASLVIFGVASQVSPGIMLMSAILTGSLMYLLYEWWFKTHTQFV